MENKRSFPVSVPLNEYDYRAIAAAGYVVTEQKAFESVRLNGEHFDAIDKIVKSLLPPDVGMRSPASRSAAIRVSLHKYCKSLSEGRRYTSFSDLVKDALLWYAGELPTKQPPFPEAATLSDV